MYVMSYVYVSVCNLSSRIIIRSVLVPSLCFKPIIFQLQHTPLCFIPYVLASLSLHRHLWTVKENAFSDSTV